MLKQCGIYMIGIAHIPKVADLQRGPKETADAAGVVAPSHAGSVFQLFDFQIPGSGLVDFRKGGFFAGLEVGVAPATLPRDGLEKILGLAANSSNVSGRDYHSITALA
jgi:hypothetical protein